MRHDLQLHKILRIRRPILTGVSRGHMVPDFPIVHVIGTINGTAFHAFENPYSGGYNVLLEKRVPRAEYDAITRRMLKLRRSDDLPEFVIAFEEADKTIHPKWGDRFTDAGHERVRVAYVEQVEALRAEHPTYQSLADWRGPNEVTPEEYAKLFPHAQRGA